MERFKLNKVAEDQHHMPPRFAYEIVDTMAEKFNLPYLAVTIRLEARQAVEVCATLNLAWRMFQRDPW